MCEKLCNQYQKKSMFHVEVFWAVTPRYDMVGYKKRVTYNAKKIVMVRILITF